MFQKLILCPLDEKDLKTIVKWFQKTGQLSSLRQNHPVDINLQTYNKVYCKVKCLFKDKDNITLDDKIR